MKKKETNGIKRNFPLVTVFTIVMFAGIVFSSCENTFTDNTGDQDNTPDQTPSAADFIIRGLTQIHDGSSKKVVITPKEGKSTGTITIYYNGAVTGPSAVGTYLVTFDIASVPGWNAVTGLAAGTLTIASQVINDPEYFTSISALTSWLSTQPGGNESIDPVPVKVNINLHHVSWNNLLSALDTADKYVELDLSASTLSVGFDFIAVISINGNPGTASNPGKYKIVSLTLPDTTNTIGHGAFRNFSNLICINIPEGVASIGPSAFWGCSGLINIIIPDSVTSIGRSAFENCSGLSNIIIPEGVTHIMDTTFKDCGGLTGVTIPDSVTSIGYHAFVNCTSLTSLTIPDSVTSIGYDAFRNCSSLISLTIPDNVTSIENYTFYGCSSLISIIIPDGVTVIDYNAFSYCSSLTSITIPNSVNSIAINAFENCSKLETINVASGNSTYSSEYGILFNKDKTVLLKCPSGKTGEVIIPNTVVNIRYRAFEYCTELTSITIGNNVIGIDGDAFFRCTGLTSVIIGNSVTSIGNYAFYHCDKLTDITIPDSVVIIGNYAFGGCTDLITVTFESKVTFSDFYPFLGLGNLLTEYLAGGPGTYTRQDGTSAIWTKI